MNSITNIGSPKFLAAVSDETVKGLFEAMTGSPSCKYRLFSKSVAVNKDEIGNLFSVITEKLRLTKAELFKYSINVKLQGRRRYQFSDYELFASEKFMVEEATEEIQIAFHILTKEVDDKTPRAHTLSIRLAPPINPMELMKLMMTTNPSDISKIESKFATCVAHVDFFNSSLADELLDIADRWFNTLPIHMPTGNWLSKLENFDTAIARVIHWSFPFWTSIFASFILYKIDFGDSVTINSLKLFGVWLIISYCMVYIMQKAGRHFGQKAYGAINAFENRHMFAITKGDDKAAAELNRNNGKSIRSLIISAGVTVILKGCGIWAFKNLVGLLHKYLQANFLALLLINKRRSRSKKSVVWINRL